MTPPVATIAVRFDEEQIQEILDRARAQITHVLDEEITDLREAEDAAWHERFALERLRGRIIA